MDTLNFGIVFPLLPEIANSFGANATMVGSLATMYAVAQLICTPLLGRLSDRIGRRPVLLLAVSGTALSSFLTGVAGVFPVLLIARLINGACGGTGGVANAYIADVTNTEEKPIYMAYISSANSLGLVLGPALGGVLIHRGFACACFVSSFLSGINLLVCFMFMPESRWLGRDERDVSLTNGATSRRSGEAAAESSPENGVAPSVPKPAYFLFGAMFLFVFAFAAFETVTGYYLKDTFFDGDSVKGGQCYGVIFVIVGIVLFFMSTFVYKPFYKRYGAKIVVSTGVVVRSTGFVLMALAPTWEFFLLSVMVQIIGSTLIFPTISAMMTTMSSKEIYGRVLSYSDASGALARVCGPLVFGRIYDNLTHAFSFYACSVAGLMAGALVLCAAERASALQRTVTSDDVKANVSFERTLTPPCTASRPGEGGAALLGSVIESQAQEEAGT